MSKDNKEKKKNKVIKILMFFSIINFIISFLFYLNKNPIGIIGGADAITEIALLNGFIVNPYIIFFIIGLIASFLWIIMRIKIKNIDKGDKK